MGLISACILQRTSIAADGCEYLCNDLHDLSVTLTKCSLDIDSFVAGLVDSFVAGDRNKIIKVASLA